MELKGSDDRNSYCGACCGTPGSPLQDPALFTAAEKYFLGMVPASLSPGITLCHRELYSQGHMPSLGVGLCLITGPCGTMKAWSHLPPLSTSEGLTQLRDSCGTGHCLGATTLWTDFSLLLSCLPDFPPGVNPMNSSSNHLPITFHLRACLQETLRKPLPIFFKKKNEQGEKRKTSIMH